MLGYTECDVKAAIEAGLTSSGGYATRSPDTYDEQRARPIALHRPAPRIRLKTRFGSDRFDG